jgi:pyrroline-5-carboxylate reductase
MQNKIAIIGGGNLGTAIAQGLLQSQFISPQQLIITKRKVGTLQHLAAQGVEVISDNVWAVQQATWIILAVKPFQIENILQELQPHLQQQKHHIISVITGVWIKDITQILGHGFSIFRAMPNTAIAIQQSITCLSSISTNTAESYDYVEAMFNNLGKTVRIDETLMDAATVLGACGTAYAMRYIRANIQGGIEIGFDAATAATIAAQTVKGAAELLLTQHTHPEQEIDKVTTPKGCTIAGLNEMEHQGFSSSLIRGVVTSYKKITADL